MPPELSWLRLPAALAKGVSILFEMVESPFPLTQMLVDVEKIYLLFSILVGTPILHIIFRLLPVTQLCGISPDITH